jgi:hypothetical protein
MKPSKRLRVHSAEAIETLRAQNFLDAMFAQMVFNEEERDEVAAMEGRRALQARKFMQILETKSEEQIQTFFDILKASPEDKQPHLYKIFFPS